MSQRRKLLAAIGVGALAALWILAYLIWVDYQQAMHSAQIRSRDYAAILETRLDATLRRADADLRLLAGSIPVAALHKQAVGRYADTLNTELDAHMVDFPELAGLRIFDSAGDQLYSSGRAHTLISNVVDRDYFIRLRDHPGEELVFSSVNISRTTVRPTLVAAKGLRDVEGVFRGIVIASVELEYFQKLFKSLDVGPNGVVSIYRVDDFTRVVRWPVGDGKLNTPLPLDNPSRAALAMGQRTATQEYTSAADGVVRVYSLHALHGYPFYVTTGIARQDALADWRARSLEVGLAGVLTIGLLAGMLFRLWRVQQEQTRSLLAQAESEERLRALFERATDGIVIVSEHGKLLSVNEAFARMHGYTSSELVSMDLQDLDTPESLEGLPLRLRRILDGELLNFEVQHYHRDGRVIALEVSSSMIVSQGERLIQAFHRDITQRKVTEELVRQMAYYDPLTKLANRVLLRDRLIQSMRVGKRSGGYGALMFLDLDNFKPLNDHHGHSVGDLLLVEAAKRITNCVRQIDTVARFGGDEFVVLLDYLPTHLAQARHQAELVAEKIRTVLAEPFVLQLGGAASEPAQEVAHQCSVSVGVVLFLGSTYSEEDILEWADAAMYQAKKSGRNAVRFHG